MKTREEHDEKRLDGFIAWLDHVDVGSLLVDASTLTDFGPDDYEQAEALA